MNRFALLLTICAGSSCSTVDAPGTETVLVDNLVDRSFNSVAEGDRVGTIKILAEALAREPNHAEALALRGNLYSRHRRHAEAIADLSRAFAIAPSIVSVSNDLAWLLATCHDDRLRDGKRALQLIETAIANGGNDGQLRDTHAAAMAECGRFAEAQQVAETAMENAPGEHMNGLRSRLFSYQRAKPWRE